MWKPISTAPEGIPVRTRVSDSSGVRNDQTLVRQGNRWFTGQGRNAMYVYYQPTEWAAY